MSASPDSGHLGPMVTAARTELAAAGVTEAPQIVVADAGYWHLEQMNALTGEGIPVLIPRTPAVAPARGPAGTAAPMTSCAQSLTPERGAQLYRQRGQLIEPLFGHIKHNRGFVRFHRRGRSPARTEWRLMATTHNLVKLHRHFTTGES